MNIGFEWNKSNCPEHDDKLLPKNDKRIEKYYFFKKFKVKILWNLKMDWHEKQINQSLRHANEHRNNVTLRTKDLSCRICYPINEETTDEKFRNFWEWYQGITSAERFSANAESVFEELMGKDMENIIEGRENFWINALIYLMGYRDNSGFSIKDIRARIVDMTSVSEKFTRDM